MARIAASGVSKVTVRRLERGGAAAFYLASGKVVVSGKTAALVDEILAFVKNFTEDSADSMDDGQLRFPPWTKLPSV